MARGGHRSGTPGKAYSNRSDLSGAQPVRVASDQPYGVAGQQEAAQRAVPLPQAPPANVGPFDRPTDRPQEPVTAGLPMGAGAGPEALGYEAMTQDDFGTQLRAVYSTYPNNDLLRLIEEMDSE